MAPKEKLVKGQRPISSFFFKKPEDTPSLHRKHELGTAVPPQPPSKRQKKEGTQHKVARGKSQSNGTPAGLTDAQVKQPHELEPIDLTGAHRERSGQPSCGADVGTTGRAKVAAPYNKDARHQRFQNKLVLGPASGLERDKTVVPQKTTPLEDQVYALKRKHPGILLLIEVCSPHLITTSFLADAQQEVALHGHCRMMASSGSFAISLASRTQRSSEPPQSIVGT